MPFQESNRPGDLQCVGPFMSFSYTDPGLSGHAAFAPCARLFFLTGRCFAEASHLGLPLDYVLLGGLVSIFQRNNGRMPQRSFNHRSADTFGSRGHLVQELHMVIPGCFQALFNYNTIFQNQTPRIIVSTVRFSQRNSN